MDFRPLLRRIRCPVLVLAGDADTAMPEGAPQLLVAGIKPGLAQLQMIRKAGHAVPNDAPKPFFRALRSFLAA
jgi:proline iminopeptidase